jgi:hypothetical protein
MIVTRGLEFRNNYRQSINNHNSKIKIQFKKIKSFLIILRLILISYTLGLDRKTISLIRRDSI